MPARSLLLLQLQVFPPTQPNSPQLAGSAKFAAIAAVAVVGWGGGGRRAKGGVSKTHICFVATTARACCFSYERSGE